MIASLPMYDWPHRRAANDVLWAQLANALRDAGFDAPQKLSRPANLHRHWKRPSLLLSQTCAMPFRLGLWRDVHVLGAVDYGLEGCAPGHYRSVLIVAKHDRRDTLKDFAGAKPAVNARNSQSGFAALYHAAEQAGIGFAPAHLTGAHSRSISAVASGEAALAAIDAVTWRLAQEVMEACAAVRVLALSEPSPGLPLICAKGMQSSEIRACLTAAFAALPDAVGHPLGIRGFVPRCAEDYRGLPW